MEALRPLGLELLKTVLAKFGDARDPLLPEQLLLEQFQAQFVSALRYPSKPLTYSCALDPLNFSMTVDCATSALERMQMLKVCQEWCRSCEGDAQYVWQHFVYSHASPVVPSVNA